jgi:hypothetical protein
MKEMCTNDRRMTWLVSFDWLSENDSGKQRRNPGAVTELVRGKIHVI